MASVEKRINEVANATNCTAESDCRKAHANKDSVESPSFDSSNPLYFPLVFFPTGIYLDGVQVMRFPVKDDPVTHIRKIQDFKIKDDDVIIAAYFKCGTHWVSEILHMLMTGKTEYSESTKEFNMFEFNEMSLLDTLPSPRVLNAHLYTPHLPKQIVEKKTKIIHLIRNPKDVAVSLYYHLKYLASDEFTFSNFIKGYTLDKYLVFSHQFNYLRQMAEFEKTHPDHPILHIHYEDLIQNSASSVKKLAQFVGVAATDDFCRAVASACGFFNMKKADESRSMPKNLPLKGRMDLYRKGVVGDWKNQFTFAQNEIFDEFLAEQKALGFGYTPKGL